MQEIQILKPKNCDFSKIIHDIKQDPGLTIETDTYPNGFVIKYISTPEQIKVETNRPLIKIDDSTYQIPE